MTNEEKPIINKNDALILKCIMKLNNCDMVYAMNFAQNYPSHYPLAMTVAQAKDEEFKAEKEALIDKACEWLLKNVSKHIHGNYAFLKGLMLEEFQQAMKGGEE